MPNLTAIERISRFIDNEPNVKPMKKWSERFRSADIPIGADYYDSRSWYLKKLIKKIRNILSLFSGNDTVEMLRGKV